MPAAIRFSEAVYDRLGHGVVGEFVDALNRVDADYRAQFEKVNEANAARFEARMDARFAELLARMDARFASVDARFAQVDARFDAFRDELTRVIAERSEAHTRWMMGGWAIIFAALIANFLKR